MGDHPIVVRAARPDDAAGVARVYIESWHDTYPSILPTQLLCAMTPRGQTARWQAAIQARGREQVLVAEKSGAGIIAMASFGPSRDSDLGFDGEVYTLYVDPSYFGLGLGRALLRSSFSALGARGYSSCVIWAHAKNPARFFGCVEVHSFHNTHFGGCPDPLSKHFNASYRQEHIVSRGN